MSIRKSLFFALIAYLLSKLFFPGYANAATFPVGWGYKCAITLPHTLVTATQTNIPWILQAAAMPAGASGLWANCNSDGGDIRFTSDSAGTIPLHMELLNWVLATPAATFYIKIPSLSSVSDTTIYIWYKNSAATTPSASDATWGSQGVWDSNFAGVYHCQEASGNLLDSTSYGNTMTANGAQGTTIGRYDKARTFDGSSTYFNVTSPDLSQDTIELWYNATGSGYNFMVNNGIASGAFGNCQVCLYGGVNGIVVTYDWRNTTGYYEWYTSSTSGTHHTAWSDTGVVGGMLGFIDGIGAITSTGDGGGTKCNFASVGALQVGEWLGGLYFKGWMQEIRISTIARSTSWITTSFNNQTNVSVCGTPGTPVPITSTSKQGARVFMIH